MIHSRKTITGIFLLAVLFAHTSSATEQTQLGAPASFVKPASVKLWRGAVNVLTGWGELIRQPVLLTQEDGAIGIPTGIINGIFMTVVRTGVGVFDVVTFPLPLDYEDGYESLINPEYVWQPAK